MQAAAASPPQRQEERSTSFTSRVTRRTTHTELTAAHLEGEPAGAEHLQGLRGRVLEQLPFAVKGLRTGGEALVTTSADVSNETLLNLVSSSSVKTCGMSELSPQSKHTFRISQDFLISFFLIKSSH